MNQLIHKTDPTRGVDQFYLNIAEVPSRGIELVLNLLTQQLRVKPSLTQAQALRLQVENWLRVYFKDDDNRWQHGESGEFTNRTIIWGEQKPFRITTPEGDLYLWVKAKEKGHTIVLVVTTWEKWEAHVAAQVNLPTDLAHQLATEVVRLQGEAKTTLTTDEAIHEGLPLIEGIEP